MRAAMGAIQRLGKNRYRVSMEGEPKPDGKRTRKTKVVRGTRGDAEVELAKMRLEAGKPIKESLTLSQYWRTFYEPTLSALAESTQSGYRYAWKGLVEPMFGDCAMDGLTAREIERRLLEIEKPGAQRNAYKLMRQMYNEAYRDELVDENPFSRRIRLKRMEAYRPEILLLPDVPAWIGAVRGAPFEPIVLCMLFGGLRREEACALFWEDVSFFDGIAAVKVDKALVSVRGKAVEAPTKTAESTRSVFIGGYPAARLEELSGSGPLCPDANGNRTNPDNVSNRYRKWMKGKDAKYVPLKNLRNSYATIMQGLGASDSLISKSLGHTNLRVDYDHYFAANIPAHISNANMLGDAVSNIL